MALFKTDEEKLIDAENKILSKKEYKGKVGVSHTGYSLATGFLDTDKVRFKTTKFKFYDDAIMIERHKSFINFSDVKEIFQDIEAEALIILNNGETIPIRRASASKNHHIEFKAFMVILNRLINENTSNTSNIEINGKNDDEEIEESSEDKFDKLIKLGEMHNNGLLSDEEFASLKQELLSGNAEDNSSISETEVETSENTCEKCGADISHDDIFCSECGAKLTF